MGECLLAVALVADYVSVHVLEDVKDVALDAKVSVVHLVVVPVEKIVPTVVA